jgi:hypothetical protein
MHTDRLQMIVLLRVEPAMLRTAQQGIAQPQHFA